MEDAPVRPAKEVDEEAEEVDIVKVM